MRQLRRLIPLLALVPPVAGLRPLAASRQSLGSGFVPPPPKQDDYVDKFCRATNDAMKQLIVPPIRSYVEIKPAALEAEGQQLGPFEKLLTPPQSPGLSRPVWLVIAASVPTALGWYGYYKFSVEEELYEDELRREGRVTGCGGAGTLLPFVFATLGGGVAAILPPLCFTPLPGMLLKAGALWILLGQVNLYRRVNELWTEKYGGEAPLVCWWALLPPPLDVVVGLRQVHFLAKYWADVRGDTWEKDVVAEELFPFISSERFTLVEFATRPSNWFWFTKDWKDFDFGQSKR